MGRSGRSANFKILAIYFFVQRSPPLCSPGQNYCLGSPRSRRRAWQSLRRLSGGPGRALRRSSGPTPLSASRACGPTALTVTVARLRGAFAARPPLRGPRSHCRSPRPPLKPPPVSPAVPRALSRRSPPWPLRRGPWSRRRRPSRVRRSSVVHTAAVAVKLLRRCYSPPHLQCRPNHSRHLASRRRHPGSSHRSCRRDHCSRRRGPRVARSR